MHTNRPAIVLSSPDYLAGCTMGPDYKTARCSDSRFLAARTGTSESIANMPWWELFKDEELQKLIRHFLTGKSGPAELPPRLLRSLTTNSSSPNSTLPLL